MSVSVRGVAWIELHGLGHQNVRQGGFVFASQKSPWALTSL